MDRRPGPDRRRGVTGVRWSRDAQNDLADAERFLTPRDPAAAARIARVAVAATGFLIDHPGAGPVVVGTSYCKWRLSRTPYLLLYRLDADVIRIVRLVHGAHNWAKLL